MDDDARVAEEWQRALEAEGYLVEISSTAADGRNRVASSSWDVILMDQKLEGPSGPDSGLELIGDASLFGAKVIVMTGFPTADAVVRAFNAGAYDYVQKGSYELTVALMRSKIRRAIALVRAERDASQSSAERERNIQELWTAVGTQEDANRKGLALEAFLTEVFRSVPGFEVHPNRRSPDEQFDLVVVNRAAGWEKESAVILVEAKNWSTRVGRDEYDLFFRKLERRHGRCQLGFLVSVGGFTSGVRTAHAADRARSELVVLVDDSELRAIIAATDRSQHLRGMVLKSVVEE